MSHEDSLVVVEGQMEVEGTTNKLRGLVGVGGRTDGSQETVQQIVVTRWWVMEGRWRLRGQMATKETTNESRGLVGGGGRADGVLCFPYIEVFVKGIICIWPCGVSGQWKDIGKSTNDNDIGCMTTPQACRKEECLIMDNVLLNLLLTHRRLHC